MSDIQATTRANGSAPATAVGAGALRTGAAALMPQPAPVPQAAIAPRASMEEMRSRLQAAMQTLNQQMANSGRTLGFSVDASTHSDVVRVMNEKTGELIRQIPAQVVIDVAHNMDAMKGVLFNGLI
jgi:flagellar protein FlaG